MGGHQGRPFDVAAVRLVARLLTTSAATHWSTRALAGLAAPSMSRRPRLPAWWTRPHPPAVLCDGAASCRQGPGGDCVREPNCTSSTLPSHTASGLALIYRSEYRAVKDESSLALHLAVRKRGESGRPRRRLTENAQRHRHVWPSYFGPFSRAAFPASPPPLNRPRKKPSFSRCPACLPCFPAPGQSP